MQWGFVDYENVGSLDAIELGEYDRIFVFLGPKNRKLKLGQISSVEFCTVELIALNTMGPNNLDFHLAFHLGRFHELADEQTEFHVITNDSGFNGLVNHIKGLGRKCKKVATRSIGVKSRSAVSLSPCAELIVKRLSTMDGRKRPRTKTKLTNWVKSQCAHVLNGSDPSVFYEELKKAKVFDEHGSAITYNVKR